jgi:hypothetical protein
MALGRAIGVLGRIADKVPAMQASATADLVEDAPAPPQQQTVAATTPPKPPVEVDRYMAAGSVYVMFSDGSVEVQTNGRARRYSSLAALRAETGVGGD